MLLRLRAKAISSFRSGDVDVRNVTRLTLTFGYAAADIHKKIHLFLFCVFYVDKTMEIG